MLANARNLLVVVAAVALGLAAGGCYGEAEAEPVGYAEVTAAPVDIETYPSVVYEGHPTYLYRDRWYYRDRGRWTYYRSEPGELHRQRGIVRRR